MAITRKQMLRIRISECDAEIRYAEQRKQAYEDELAELEKDEQGEGALRRSRKQ